MSKVFFIVYRNASILNPHLDREISMKKFLIAMILTTASFQLWAGCDYSYSLTNHKYNCQIQKVGGTAIEQFASTCYCEDSVKYFAQDSEGPIHAVSNLRCKKLWVNINTSSKPDSDFHEFKVQTYLKNVPISQTSALRTRYLKVRKSKCY